MTFRESLLHSYAADLAGDDPRRAADTLHYLGALTEQDLAYLTGITPRELPGGPWGIEWGLADHRDLCLLDPKVPGDILAYGSHDAARDAMSRIRAAI